VDGLVYRESLLLGVVGEPAAVELLEHLRKLRLGLPFRTGLFRARAWGAILAVKPDDACLGR
jgi:hypothetical protein